MIGLSNVRPSSRHFGSSTLFCHFCILVKTAHHAPQGMEYSGGPRRVVAGHPWTATSIDEVASSEASPSEAEFECCSSATRDHFTVESVGCAPEEVSRRGPCGRFDQDSSHPGGDCQSWTNAEERATLETALARSRQLAAVPPCGQEDCRHRGVHRTCAEARRCRSRQDLRSREIEAVVRGGVGPGRERFGRFPSRGRDVPGQWRSPTPSACHRRRPSLRESEQSWLSRRVLDNPDAPCVPVVKRTCRMGDGRAVIPAMPNLVPA